MSKNQTQFTPKWFILTTIAAIALLVCLAGLFTGCAAPGTLNQESHAMKCQKAQQAWDLYQAAISAGHKPSEDESKIAAAAQLFIALYCGARPPGASVTEVDDLADIPTGERAGIPTKGKVRQPERIRVLDSDGTWINYYRVSKLVIIQDPDGIYPPQDRNPLATITTGPLYRRQGYDGVYMPSHDWLMRKANAVLIMHHLW